MAILLKKQGYLPLWGRYPKGSEKSAFVTAAFAEQRTTTVCTAACGQPAQPAATDHHKRVQRQQQPATTAELAHAVQNTRMSVEVFVEMAFNTKQAFGSSGKTVG
ncbi:acid shock protein [Neisseria bacilliformis ATCC BAA-1200]|uniref:Acid shock protein n=1 Tax=Neisseria bacilliformis ATCC BAA-1200 TaxID=888742 RepID=F2B8P0_9NEIS|nr:acid shock protein [Neisseria bacilliformis ATCC BAA-1200]